MALEAKTSRYLFYGALILTVFAAYLGQSRLGNGVTTVGSQKSSESAVQALRTSDLAVDSMEPTSVRKPTTGDDDFDEFDDEFEDDEPEATNQQTPTTATSVQKPNTEEDLDDEFDEDEPPAPTTAKEVVQKPVTDTGSTVSTPTKAVVTPTNTGTTNPTQPQPNAEATAKNTQPEATPKKPQVSKYMKPEESKNKKVCVICSNMGDPPPGELDVKIAMQIANMNFDLVTRGPYPGSGGCLGTVRGVFEKHENKAEGQISIYAPTNEEAEKDVAPEGVDRQLEPKPEKEMPHIEIADFIIALDGNDLTSLEIAKAKELNKPCIGLMSDDSLKQADGTTPANEKTKKALEANGYEAVYVEEFGKIVALLGNKEYEAPPEPTTQQAEPDKTNKPDDKTKKPAKSSASKLFHGAAAFGALVLALSTANQ